MPQFYETDSLQCWIHSCISEKYDMLFNEGESSEYLRRVTECVKNLEEEAEEFLHLDQVGCESSLFKAILNTIDFPDLLKSLKEQYEDELDEINERINKLVEKKLEGLKKCYGCGDMDKDGNKLPDTTTSCVKCDEPEVIYDKAKGIDKTDKMGRPDFFTIMAQRETARKEASK